MINKFDFLQKQLPLILRRPAIDRWLLNGTLFHRCAPVGRPDQQQDHNHIKQTDKSQTKYPLYIQPLLLGFSIES